MPRSTKSMIAYRLGPNIRNGTGGGRPMQAVNGTLHRDGQPVCSVIIPTYNRRALVVEAVTSVLAQHCDGIEIIVVDDGSTDGTADALRQFGNKVRYFFQGNRGPSAARNVGIERARGEFVSFLDSDDVWSDGKLAMELALFHQYPQADVIAGNARAFVENVLRWSDVLMVRKIVFEGLQPRYFDWSMEHLRLGPLCVTSSLIIKREALRRLGPRVFDENLFFDEDWDMEFRMFERCKVLFYPQVLTTIRAFDDGTRLHYSFPGKAKSLAEKRLIRNTQINILDRYLSRIEWGAEAESSFRRQRALLIGKMTENSVIFEERNFASV